MLPFFVIPAKAGIQSESRVRGDMKPFVSALPRVKDWSPAFAGMTGGVG